MYLTSKIYGSLIGKKLHHPNCKINIKEFLNYFADYFYVFSKLKNFRIQFNHGFDDELIVVYQYYRVILFSTLLFILNNSDSTTEKVLEVNVQAEKDFTHNLNNNINSHNINDYKLKFEFRYHCEKPKINFNDMYLILYNRTKGMLKGREELRKIKFLDVGILVVYYIVNLIYDNDLISVSEGDNHYLAFTLKGKYAKGNLSGIKGMNLVSLETKKFKEPRSIIFTQYYDKILLKVYKITPPIAHNLVDIIRKLGEIGKEDIITTSGLPSIRSAERRITDDFDKKAYLETCNLIIYIIF